MTERILFLTGKLAEKSLNKTLNSIESRDFDFEVRALGVSVAALMTTDLIARRLDNAQGFDRAILPGRCRGQLEKLTEKFQIPFERGPEELKDLPQFFGGAHHGGAAVLRLLAAGSQGQAARADFVEAGRQLDRAGGRGPRTGNGTARRADPGLL